MNETLKTRNLEFQKRMSDANIDVVLLADPDFIFYFTAYWGDLGVEFGRPSIVSIPKDGEPTLITSSIEGEMSEKMTWVSDIQLFSDGIGREWVDPLRQILDRHEGHRIAVVPNKVPSLVLNYLLNTGVWGALIDCTEVLSIQRMIKSPEEIHHIRQASQVATAMTDAARAVIGEGVSEYELSIAIQAGGTRKAAEIIEGEDRNSLMSPVIHILQSINSGPHTSMAHMRPTVHRFERGDPIYLCFCGICHFKQFKIGYDRQYWVGEMPDEHARIYEIPVEAQQTAVRETRPVVTAEYVHLASAEVYKEHGLGLCYRTGRAVGYSSLEFPELKEGDKTIFAPGMFFAVDGGVTVAGEFGSRIGDTILITDDGAECFTEYPRNEPVVING